MDFSDTPLSVLAENLILPRYAGYRNRLHGLIAVLKVGFSDYDRAVYEYTISSGRGIDLLGPAPPAIGLLTGVAQPTMPDSDPQVNEREE